MTKVTSHANAILYIPRMRIVRQPTLSAHSSNMRTLSYYCCSSQARSSVKLARSPACIELALALLQVSSWLLLCYSYQAGWMLCIRHQYGSMLCIRHHYGSVSLHHQWLWLSAVHPWLAWLNAIRHQYVVQCCPSCRHIAIWWLCIMQHYGSCNAVHHASKWLILAQ